MTTRDWSKVKRHRLSDEGPRDLPAIVRKLVWRHEFKAGSELLVYADNERDTYEAVLRRTGLPTRSARVPKYVQFEPEPYLNYLLGMAGR